MRGIDTEQRGDLSIEGERCVIRLANQEVILARCLGITKTDTEESIYLDRLVHLAHHTAYCGYQPSGAISTILTRTQEAPHENR